MTISLDKSMFFQEQVDYLGLDLSSSGCSVSKDKLKILLEYPIPKTSH